MNIFKSLIALAFVAVSSVQAQEVMLPEANQVTLRCEEYGFKKMNRFSVDIVLNNTDAGSITSAHVYRENLEGQVDLVKQVDVKRKMISLFIDPTYTDPTDASEHVNYAGLELSLSVDMVEWTEMGYQATLKTVIGEQMIKRNLFCQQVYYAL